MIVAYVLIWIGWYQVLSRSIAVVVEARLDYHRWVAENWQTA